MPPKTPSIRPNNNERPVTRIVGMRALKTIIDADLPLLNEFPKSKWNITCLSHKKYWRCSGSLSPNLSAIFSLRAGSIEGSIKRVVGSPGAKWIIKKVKVSPISRTGRMPSSRLKI